MLRSLDFWSLTCYTLMGMKRKMGDISRFSSPLCELLLYPPYNKVVIQGRKRNYNLCIQQGETDENKVVLKGNPCKLVLFAMYLARSCCFLCTLSQARIVRD